MNFWKAAAIQLLAISLREFRYQDKVADTSLQCWVPEVACTCTCDPPELPSREFRWLELTGGVIVGSAGSWLVDWSCRRSGRDESTTSSGRDGHRRRRGGGVLSDHEAGEEISSLVQ